MNYLDWMTIVGFLLFILVLGVMFSKKGGHDTSTYFVAGRKLPWWLAGMSMTASAFGSDTPMIYSAMARRSGLLGCWYFFRQVLTQMTIGVMFGKLWRRSRVITDVEFYELRHGGKGASALRCFLGGYFGLIYTPLRIAIFIVGMQKLCTELLGLPETFALGPFPAISSALVVAMTVTLIALIYSASAGIIGVVWTDFFEFLIAIVGTYVLMFYAIAEVGGLSALRQGILDLFQAKNGEFDPLAILPFSRELLTVPMLFYLFGFWWLVHEAGGQGAAAQRLLSCRSERDAGLSMIWNVCITFMVRSWPWIITGFASLLLFPGLADHELAYPAMIRSLLPHGLLGLMMVSFLCAFLSSIDTNFNLGASYAINDLYRRFLVRGATEKHYMRASRLATILIALVGVGISLFAQSMLGILMFAMKLGAGYGLIKILRWFWWRINAWCEFAAAVSGLAWAMLFLVLKQVGVITPADWLIDNLSLSAGIFSERALYFSVDFIVISALTVVTSFVVLYLTPPSDMQTLERFYTQIRPGGPGWRPVAKRCPNVVIRDRLTMDVVGLVIGLICVYCGIFAAGYLMLGIWRSAVLLAVIFFVSGTILLRFFITQTDVPEQHRVSSTSGSETS